MLTEFKKPTIIIRGHHTWASITIVDKATGELFVGIGETYPKGGDKYNVKVGIAVAIEKDKMRALKQARKATEANIKNWQKWIDEAKQSLQEINEYRTDSLANLDFLSGDLATTEAKDEEE